MIEVVVGSNVSQATAGIEKFKNSLNTLPAAMKPLSGGILILNNQIERLHRIANSGNLSFKQFERVNGLIASTRTQMEKLTAASASVVPAFNRLGASSNSANQALINTGRVFQDLPFGILGVANNLNPLLESFQRASAAAKETGTSLKSNLLASLTGGGGLGLALSIASSALIVFGNTLFGTGRQFDTAASRANNFKDALNGIKEAAETLRSFLDFQDKLKNLDFRIKFGDGLAADVNEANAAIKSNETVIKSETKNLNALNETFKDLQASIKTGIELDPILKGAGKFTAIGNLLKAGRFDALKLTESEIGELNKQQQDLVNRFQTTNKSILESEKRLKDAKQGVILESGELEKKRADDAREQQKKMTDDFKKFVDDTISRARQFTSEFGDAFVVPDLSDSFLKTKDQIFKSSKQLLEDVKNLNLKVRVPVDIDFDFVPAEIGPPLARVGKDLEEAMRAITGIKLEPIIFEPKLIIALQDEAEFKKLVEQGKKMFSKLGPAFTDVFAEQFAEAVQAGMKKGLSEVKAIEGATIGIGIEALGFSTMLESFDKLVDAIADGKNAFASFGQFVTSTIKGVVVQLLKAAAAAAILSLITGGAGKGGMNFIGALGKIFGGGRFAKGGIVPSGYPNDSYPALLSSHEVVLNPQQISSLMSSRTTSEPIVMAVEWSGDIMRLVQRRSEKRAGRSYG